MRKNQTNDPTAASAHKLWAEHPPRAPSIDGPPLIAIHYEHGGVALRGWLALPSSGTPVPGVIVAHEAIGMNDHVKARAQALAAIGYAAFAIDMYGEAFPLEEAMGRHQALVSAPGLVAARACAAADVLAALSQVRGMPLGAIGFCQGGAVARELLHAGRVRCAIGIHPGLCRPAGGPEGPIAGRVVMIVGDLDPVSPPSARLAFAADMTARGADWELHLLGGVGHTFTNPDVDALGRPGFFYHAAADRRSWATVTRVLHEELIAAPAHPDLGQAGGASCGTSVSPDRDD